MHIPRFSVRSIHSIRAIPTSPRRGLLAVAAFLLLLSTADEARSESPFNPEGRIDAEQFILPWDGPGAAVFNPALITETKRVDGRFAIRMASPETDGEILYQGSGNSPWGIAVGFNRFENGSAIDRSNIVFEEAISTMMIAWGVQGFRETGFDAGVGLAYVRHDYNLFAAMRSKAHAWDFGIHAATPGLGRAGRLHTGLTLRNLAAEKVKLPDDNPEALSEGYDVLLYNFDASFLLKSALDCLDVFLEFNFHQDHDASEGPPRDGPSLIKSMGAEYRPVPHVGLKIERTWLKRWTAGLAGYGRIPVGNGVEVGAEVNVSHDKFLSPKDEGRGYLWSVAMNAGM
jgi:hypothetical protein